jgi:Flp pilus assembly protein TadD
MSEGSDGGRDSRPGRDVAAVNDQELSDSRRNDGPAEAAAGLAPDDGDTYGLYQRGLALLERGSAAAAAQLLERAAAAEPHTRSVLEALARAQFDAGRHAAAAATFRRIVEASPADDYAQFGLGLALSRTGDPAAAAEHLALAAAMRPNLAHYTEALRSVRATLSARSKLRHQGETPD